ncbi:MAG: hypothetical protein RLY86_1568 [Pseudomonadota bacterium]|jgi:hypothetical protein
MPALTTPNGFNLDNTGRRIVVDPVTRIEGHMRVEVNLDADNIIRNAVSTGTMWRGLEVILKGRDPRDAWAFTERICDVCTGTHALTSVRAVENALGIMIPENANTIRNIMQLTLHQTGFQDVLSAADLLGGSPAEVLLIGVQAGHLDDYGGSLTDPVRAQVEPALALALDQLAAWGFPATRRAVPKPPAMGPGLDLDSYESGRPSAELACRIGDDRFLPG